MPSEPIALPLGAPLGQSGPPAADATRDAALDADRRRARRVRRRDFASPAAQAFYVRVMKTLDAAKVGFLVGGTYAFTPYTGIARSTKDFDIFVRKEDAERALDVLADSGLRVEMTFPHWLAKVFHRKYFVDLIFNSGTR